MKKFAHRLNGQFERKGACDHVKNPDKRCQCHPRSFPNGVNSLWVHPPSPLLQPTTTPQHVAARPCYVMALDLLGRYTGSHVPCPECGDVAGNVIRKGWNPNVRVWRTVSSTYTSLQELF